MSKSKKLTLDLKLSSLKLKSILEEVTRLNDSILGDLEASNIDEHIIISEFKLLYHTVHDLAHILDGSLSVELKEKLKG